MNARDILEEFSDAAKLAPPQDAEMRNTKAFVVRGSPISRRQSELRERFLSHVDRSGGPAACHLWTLKTERFQISSSGPRASRKVKAVSFRMFAWFLEHGKMPTERIWPTCKNGRCCNPLHLDSTPLPWIPGTRYRMTNPPEHRKRKRLPDEEAPPSGVRLSGRSALGRVVEVLDELDATERGRLLRAVVAYYGEVPR